jgi:membrane fusion protein, multidrug efflux system
MRAATFFAVGLLIAGTPLAQAADFAVHPTEVQDWKAVIATVEPIHEPIARARIGGTLAAVKVTEGASVKAGDLLATVADRKLVLQMQALGERIKSQQATRDQAKTDLDRVQELQRRGVASQTQLDQARTALDVADRTLSAMHSDYDVIQQQMSEGAVLAPADGRVLSVPVTEGQVVMPGETIATIAEDHYILRLRLPERHAQFMKAGDKVQIGARGLGESAQEARRTGRVRVVYPQISGGLVLADVEVSGLGDYFVGERTRVYVTTGQREALLVPEKAVYSRAGAHFVHLKDGSEVVVQPGDTRADDVEILSGLHDGDVVVTP